jgi:arylsulfatase A-like enzyme
MRAEKLKRPNLLLITIDALRADHLGCLGYPRKVSPHIDRLASEGTLFTQAIANGPRSPASFPSMMASIHQSAGARQEIPQQATTLAEVLKKHGYATAGFCAGNVYISRYYGYQRGFDLFQDFLTLESGEGRPSRESTGKLAPLKRFVRRILENSGRYDPAFLLFSSALRGQKNIADMAKSEDVHPFEGGEVLNEHAKAWLSRPWDRPFFLWLHYMDVHFPYLPRLSRYRPSDYGRFVLSLICLLLGLYAYPRRVLVDLYDERIRDADEILARFLNWLQRRGLYEDTLVVLTADHGEEFHEHGGWVHGAKLYDELLRVPLLMKGPGLVPGAVVGRQIGLIDLAPTILDLLGIQEKVESFQGSSFLPRLGDDQSGLSERYVFSQEVHLGGGRAPLWGADSKGNKLYRIRSCRSEKWKYIWDEEGPKRELYHLDLDPKETKNLADSEPEMAGRFESIMREQFSRLDSLESATVSMTQRVYSQQEEEEIVRRLHDLGYF